MKGKRINIDEVLGSIQSESLQLVKAEFRQLLETAKTDNSRFIRESAEEIQEMLVYFSQNELSAEDLQTFLKKQKTLAEVEANKAQIETSTRIQKVTFRLLAIALDVLATAIPAASIPAMVAKKLLHT